jgi:AcrR family transcriptional regulator
MPTPSSPRKKPSAKKASSTPTTAEREPRGARRKRETRGRLLEAALRLMAKKGMEGVAINEITEAADVGFGSFYNHFESKEAIYGAVIEWVFEDFADALDRLVSDIADPAEVVSVSVRHTLLRAQRELVWGQFLIREGFSARVLERGLGQRLLRDIKRGIASGRFKREDALMSFLSVGGTVLASISVWLQFHQAQGTPDTAIDQLGLNVDDLPQRVAKQLLLTLGLTRLEAEKIAYRPLPGDGILPETVSASVAAVAG